MAASLPSHFFFPSFLALWYIRERGAEKFPLLKQLPDVLLMTTSQTLGTFFLFGIDDKGLSCHL